MAGARGTGRLAPASGRLLVAAPMLLDPNFARTVVYLLEHDGGGSVGVVLNRPSRTPVGQVLPDWHDAMSEPAVVFGGGPVQPDGALCLGQVRAAAADRSGVRLLGEPADEGGDVPPATAAGAMATVDLDGGVQQAVEATQRLRVFAGHAGWSAGQLAGELEQGAWFVLPGEPADVFSSEPRSLWRTVLRRQPPPLSLLSTYPADLALN